MTDEQGYEIWDETLPTLPAVSRLYHLAPMALGTPEGESLTSYVVRLAAAHHVSVRSLVVSELREQLGPAFSRATYLNRLAMFWRRDAATLNGTSMMARAWVRALQTLTHQPALEGLTMLRWGEVLAATRLVRITRAWCPGCYDAQRQEGGVVYDLLRWALECVTWCPRHSCALVEQCPGCGYAQPMLAPHARPGCCSSCGSWLGAPPHATATTAEATVHPWQLWLTRAAGSLVAAAGMGAAPRRSQIEQVVNALIDRMPWRRGAPLARLLHTTESVVGAWRHGQQLPQLENLARLSACLGRLPAEVLTESDVGSMVRSAGVAECLAPPQRVRPPYQRRDWDAVRAELAAALAAVEEPPPSMREVGNRMEVAASHLRVRFPDLCRAISARYQAYWRAHAQRRKADLAATIRQAVLQVHQGGWYPDVKRVARVLPKPGLMRAPEARAAWRTTLAELGWSEQPAEQIRSMAEGKEA